MWRGVARKLQSFNILTIPSNSHACCKNKFVYIVQRSVFLSQCRMLLLHRVNMSLRTCYVSQPSEFACLYKSGHAVNICAMQNILGKFAFSCWISLNRCCLFSHIWTRNNNYCWNILETYLLQCCSAFERFISDDPVWNPQARYEPKTCNDFRWYNIQYFTQISISNRCSCLLKQTWDVSMTPFTQVSWSQKRYKWEFKSLNANWDRSKRVCTLS